MRHKHADLMIEYANDTSIIIQFEFRGVWEVCGDASGPLWNNSTKYRRKPEPKMLVRWVNVYSDPDTDTDTVSGVNHSTRALADRKAEPDRIACIHIQQEYTEGEGLDDE